MKINHFDESFESFRSLINLIYEDVGISFTEQLGKNVLSPHDFSLPLFVKDSLLGHLSFSRSFTASEVPVLERLIKNFGGELELLQLREEAFFMSTVLDNISEGLVACDAEGILRLFNKKTIEFHGLPNKPIPAEEWANYYDLYNTDGTTPLEKKDIPLFRAFNGEAVVDAEMVIHRNGHHKVNILCNAQKLLGRNGESIGALATMREENQFKRELEKVESRFQTIFQQSPLSIQICSPDGKTVLVNPAWKKLWGIPEQIIQEFILKDYNMLEDPILEAQGVLDHIKRGFSGEVTKIPVIKYSANEGKLKGRERYVEGLMYPLTDSFGNLKETVLIHIDVTDKVEGLRFQNFLSNVSTILNSSLDYEKTILKITEACVPDLADGCIIDLIQDQEIRRLLTRHKLPEIQKLLEELQEKFPPTMDSPQPSAQVIRTGKPEMIKQVDQAVILSRTINQEHADLISKVGINSHIAVPLIIRGAVIGSISLMITSERSAFDEGTLQASVELAHRASLAIENSELYSKSQQSVKLRDEFISIASHELKTPITSMKLQFQLVERILNSEQSDLVDKKYLQKMTERTNKQLNRLTLLVEDMLDISRIASGKLGIKLTSCNLSRLVEEVLQQLSYELEDFNSIVESDIEQEIVVECDSFRIEQVITNLVTNAIRYGMKNPIKVSLKRTSGQIRIEVQDHGMGLAEADLGRIFERFERATTSNISGLGLGLFISRQIMQQHRGTLTVKSELGKGSIFTAAFSD
ncbi:MAG TPA: PAS domain-containing sensor histidine kinase [Bacteriovoracaceae bacterium]|nr:PAS domain-containing sensor histidine kinase [Bacteriovoracaceae bacterium]